MNVHSTRVTVSHILLFFAVLSNQNHINEKKVLVSSLFSWIVSFQTWENINDIELNLHSQCQHRQ